MTGPTSPFVLVHGAWQGADCFRKVRPRLAAAGREVFTPCLTGVGERAHLASPQVDLSTHIGDVVRQVLYEDLTDIVLLGFSYGGIVVTGALPSLAERIRHLVYLDAFVPDDGDTAFGLVGLPPPGTVTIGADWLVPAPEREFDDPADAAFSTARRTPHPIGCFTEPVRVPTLLEEYAFTRTYVKATADGGGGPGTSTFWKAAARAKESPAWSYHEIDTTHMVPVNRPDALVDLLLQLDRWSHG